MEMDNQNNDNKNVQLDGRAGANGGDFYINVYGGSTVHFDGNIHFSQGGGVGSRLDLGNLDGTGVNFIQGHGDGAGGDGSGSGVGDDGSS